MSDIQTVWNANTKKPSSYDNTYKNSEADVCRLIEDPGVQKRIQFDELSLPLADNRRNLQGAEGTATASTYLGSAYPIIRINDAYIARDDIKSMTLESSGFVPTISLSLEFKTTEFINRHLPKDGDMLSLYISVNSSGVKYLRNDFVITSCSSSVKNSIRNKVSIRGKMFVPRIDSIQNSMGIIGTSKYVFKDIAKQFGLGFAYNDSADTNDYMNWICCKQSIPSFLEDVINHSWKDGIDFYKMWIDLYYNLCFVNVNKFLLAPETSENNIDVTYLTNTLNFLETIKDPNAENQKIGWKIFSNNTSFSNTPFFIDKWSPINNSSAISMNYGYESDSYVYIHNQKVYEEDPSTCYNISNNVPNYDQTKVDTHILLRGRGRWEEGQNPDDDKRRVNYDFTHTYIDSNWCGVEYVMGEEDRGTKNTNNWSGNVHPNYGHAPFHNMINNIELDKLYIVIECPGLCLQVMRGEKVPVWLFYPNHLDYALNNQPKNDDIVSPTNKFYSGFYIVDSIEYTYKPSKGERVGYRTRLTLKRREWPTPEPILKTEEVFENADNNDA